MTDLLRSSSSRCMGVAKIFGLQQGMEGGGIRAMMKVSRFLIPKCWQVWVWGLDTCAMYKHIHVK